MTPEEALNKAQELNKTGKHRDEWHYYPSYNDGRGKLPAGWFVMRRRKQAELRVAVFSNGSMGLSE